MQADSDGVSGTCFHAGAAFRAFGNTGAVRIELFGTCFHAGVAVDAMRAQADFIVYFRLESTVCCGDKRHQGANGTDFCAPFPKEGHFKYEYGWKHNETPGGFSQLKQMPNPYEGCCREPYGAYEAKHGKTEDCGRAESPQQGEMARVEL